MAKAELTCAALHQGPLSGSVHFDNLIPVFRAAPLIGHYYDDGDEHTGV